MTEAEWLASCRPRDMLAFLRGEPVSARKYRLYACAAVRQLWDQLDDERSRNAVEVAEQFADGRMTRKQLAESEARVNAGSVRGGAMARKTLLRSARMAANDISYFPRWTSLPPLLRCVFRHPSSPPAVADPAWLTWNGGAVLKVATGVYNERQLPQGTLDPAGLLALSDALQEAGCEDAEILAHLRGPSPHVRGCWVVDLLLRKQ